MARSAVRFTNGLFVSIEGDAEMAARAQRLPAAIQQAVGAALARSAEETAGLIRSTAPVSHDRRGGSIKDSVHVAQGSTPLSHVISVDARDEDGKFYAAHVEYGHVTKAGVHVAAEPFFWQAVRVGKRRARSRVSSASSRAIKQVTSG